MAFSARPRPAPGATLALAVSLALHLLAALLWVQERRPPLPEAPRAISIQLRPPAPPRARPADRAPRSAAPIQSRVQPPASVATPAQAAQADAKPDDQVPAAPSPPVAAPAPGLDDARAPADVTQAIRDQAAADGGFAAGLSRRQAGRIDRELRNGKSGVPDEPDTPIGRLRRGLERAHVDRSTAVHEDSYTSPDGTTIYRKRIGKGASCRRGGNISPLGMRYMVMGGEAGDDVPCPPGVQWNSD